MPVALPAERTKLAADISPVQSATLSDSEGEISPVFDVVGKGGGQPLAPQLRAHMEAGLGADFSDVRVHTDAAAARSAAAVSARAYTLGHEVVFGHGSFAPDSPEGKQRLVHELVHVQQQRKGPVPGTDTGTGVTVSDPSDSFEQEAEATATRISSGLQQVADGPRSTVQRDPAADQDDLKKPHDDQVVGQYKVVDPNAVPGRPPGGMATAGFTFGPTGIRLSDISADPGLAGIQANGEPLKWTLPGNDDVPVTPTRSIPHVSVDAGMTAPHIDPPKPIRTWGTDDRDDMPSPASPSAPGDYNIPSPDDEEQRA
jgi:hypothetical protein